MKTITLFISLVTLNVFAQECVIDPDLISAKYEISNNANLVQDNAQHNAAPILFELHRKKNSVLQRFEHLAISNIWTYRSNERIALVRAFENYQHTIEYQPNELIKKPSWQSLFQPVPVPDVAKMEMISQTGKGCQVEQKYRLKSQNTEYQVTWLPKLQLVSYFQIKNSQVNKEWHLTSYQERSPRSAQLFKQYTQYNSTDYADIGDNESIPFLAKMINQGFSQTQQNGLSKHSHVH